MLLVKPTYDILNMAADPLELIEAAGRTCYKSEDRITSESAPAFVARIIKRGHESVLEHSNIILQVTQDLCNYLSCHYPYIRATRVSNRCIVSGNIRAWRDAAKRDIVVGNIVAKLHGTHKIVFDDFPQQPYYHNVDLRIGVLQPHDLVDNIEVLTHARQAVRIVCDRGVSHEIVRHRTASYSQESTRYCDYNRGEVAFVIPPWVGISNNEPTDYMSKSWRNAMQDAENHYKYLRSLGWKPEQARSVLPNSLKTEIVMTANLSDWYHFFKLRTDRAAHPQMREIAQPMLAYFQRLYPDVFDNILLPSVLCDTTMKVPT